MHIFHSLWQYLQNHVIPEDSEEAAISLKVMDQEIFYKDQDDFRAFADKFSRENMMMVSASGIGLWLGLRLGV